MLAAAADSIGVRIDRTRAINDGWDSLVFEVNGSWIFRFPRRAEVADHLHAECRLLGDLAPALSYAVPTPDRVRFALGRPFMAYRAIPGRPFTATDDAGVVGRALRELHDYPAARAASQLEQTADIAGWVDRYRLLAADVDGRVLPLLDEPLRGLVERGLANFLLADWTGVEPRLVHADLGADHLLMHDAVRLSGIIDFGDATVGDPVIDFVGLRITGGAEAVRAAATAYGCAVDADRLHVYYWLGAVHAILYGLQIRDRETVADGVAGLRNRLTPS